MTADKQTDRGVGGGEPSLTNQDHQELHDLVREALENSMGPDWSYTLGATYVVDALVSAAGGRSDLVLALDNDGGDWRPTWKALASRDHASSCAVHNPPAEPAGACDCEACNVLRELFGLALTFRDYAHDMASGALRGRDGQSYEAIGREDLARVNAAIAKAEGRDDAR